MSYTIPFGSGEGNGLGVAFLFMLGDDRVEFEKGMKGSDNFGGIAEIGDFVGEKEFDLYRIRFGGIVRVGFADEGGPPRVSLDVCPDEAGGNV